jgi:signal transduction histidine kinase
LIGLSVWLLTNDWEDEYVQLVARWSLFGTVIVAFVYGWVLLFQLVFQNDLKPYIIAADGVVIGALVLFVAGVYNARSRRESAARAVERDRFSALFDNTSDVTVAVEFEDGTARITDVNAPFVRTFDRGKSDVIGRPVVDLMSDWVVESRDVEPEPDTGFGDRMRSVLGDPDSQVEIRWSTAEGPRDFLLNYVPVGDGADTGNGAGGFLVCTDVTLQKERERQFEVLSEGTEGLLEARTTETVLETVRTLATDLIEDTVMGVWEYDPERDMFDPCWTIITGTSETQLDDPPALPAVRTVDTEQHSHAGEDGDTTPEIDTDAFATTLSEDGITVRDTFVRRLTPPYRIVVGSTARLTKTDRYLITLLATNTRTALQRVEREETLARRNDQLEFVNSLLRHDIQNSMTIIRARGRALSESLSETEADYAETIVDQSDDVIDLIDRFRALLDALADDGDPTFEAVSLSSVLREKVETLRRTYPDATFTVTVPDAVEVVADDMLENVLGNVLGNAVEHNDSDNPTVEVSVTEREQIVVVQVADDGPGIPDEQKETIFRRGNRGLKEADIGSGFGLFFVDTMMERYGGHVAVTDNEPSGAVFELRFPKA